MFAMPRATRLFPNTGSSNPHESPQQSLKVSRYTFHLSAVSLDNFFCEGVILIVQGAKLIEDDILLCVQSKMAELTEREREKQ